MRTMLKLTVPVESGNRAIKDGSLPQILQKAMAQLQPEAAYFLADRGVRSAYIVFDLKDPSQIPVIAEPFFMGFDATVEFLPVMTPEDLQKGLQALGGQG